MKTCIDYLEDLFSIYGVDFLETAGRYLYLESEKFSGVLYVVNDEPVFEETSTDIKNEWKDFKVELEDVIRDLDIEFFGSVGSHVVLEAAGELYLDIRMNEGVLSFR